MTEYTTGAGQTTTGLVLEGSDTQTVAAGGVANATTLYGSAQLTLNGGTVHDTQILGTPGVLQEPFFSVSDGSNVANTVIHHGTMRIDGGTVVDTIVSSTDPSDHASVYIAGGTVTNISANFGNLYTFGGTVTGVTLNGSASQGIGSNARVSDTTVNAGAQQAIHFLPFELHTDSQGQYDNVINTVVNEGGTLVLESAGISGVTLNSGASVDFRINDPSSGRVHDFSSGSASVDQSNVLTIADSTFSFSLQLTGNYNSTTFTLASNPQGGTTLHAVCFCRGTAIRTPQGDRAVESLRCGDSVTTKSGKARVIRWVGRSAAIVSDETRPVIIAAGAFPAGTPYRNLRVTRGHSFVFGNVLIPIGTLVNGRTIRWDREARYVEVFHIELDVHDIVLAEGAPAESYRDDGNGAMFRSDKVTSPGTMPTCLAVVNAGPIVDRTRERLAEHARSMFDQSPTVLGSESVRSSIS
jgi:hypothetical protein